MKKLCSFILAAVLFLWLSPCVFAQTLLEKPGAGQLVFFEADNAAHYQADFPLCSVSLAYREQDDLVLQFPAAKLTLRGFFGPMGEWRSLSFTDDRSISGSSFDGDGNFTGSYSKGDSFKKSELGETKSAFGTSVFPSMAHVALSQSGSSVSLDGLIINGKAAEPYTQAVAELVAGRTLDWQKKNGETHRFMLRPDGSLKPMESIHEFSDGISVYVLNPHCLIPGESLCLSALCEGRAHLSFSNSAGEKLMELDVQCVQNENGTLVPRSLCPHCGHEQGEKLHLQLCGHFDCDGAWQAADHKLGECGLAGHCAEEGEHSKCVNCGRFVCDGQYHGIGVCEHVHNWVMQSIFSSRCSGCGMVYTSTPTVR